MKCLKIGKGQYKLLLFMIIFNFLLEAPAHAGLVDCWRMLMGKPPTPQAQQRAMIRKEKKLYETFLRERRRNPQVKPPMKENSTLTTNDELIFGFHYWWFPGNVWNSLMSSEYGPQGSDFYATQRSSQVHLPDPESLYQSETLVHSLNLPDELPSFSDMGNDGGGGWGGDGGGGD